MALGVKGSRPPQYWIFAALFAVQILFGLNYVISKIVVESFPPLVWASIRIVIATIFMFGIAKAYGAPKPKTNWKDFYKPLIFLALTGTVINQTCFLVGLKYTTSTNSAVLNTLIPVFTLLIVTLRGQEPLTFSRALGFLSAFGGVLVIRGIENFKLSDQTVIGDLLTIINCLSYGIFLSFSKRFFETHDRMWATAYIFLLGSVGIILISIPQWSQVVWPVMTGELIFCAIFAILGGTLFTYFLNNWALAYTKSSNVALWIYIQPVIAAGLAYFWKHEPITTRTLLATFLIFVGLVLALASSSRAKSEKALLRARNAR